MHIALLLAPFTFFVSFARTQNLPNREICLLVFYVVRLLGLLLVRFFILVIISFQLICNHLLFSDRYMLAALNCPNRYISPSAIDE